MFLLWGKHINKYYLKYLIFFLVGLASLITVDWFQLELPEVLGSIVQYLKEHGTIDLTSSFFHDTMIHVIYLAFILLGGRVLWRLSLLFASKKIEAHMRHEIYLKAEALDVTYYHSHKIGNIMSWATNDLDTLEEFLGWGTLMMVDGIFLTSFAIVKMFVLTPSLGLISLLPIALIALVGALCSGAMSNRWRLRQEANDALYDFSQESFTGIRVIKAFVKEKQQIHEFRKIAKKSKDFDVKFVFVSTLFDVLIEIVIAVIISIILGFGGWFVYAAITGNPVVIFDRAIIIQPGELVTFIGYFFSLIWPMIALGQVVTGFSKARASYHRIANFLDVPIDIVDSESAIDVDIKGNISFNHFSFTYPNTSKEVLHDITLEIKRGQQIGIVGTIGSGKTTLVNSLLHLYNINPHQVFIDGTDISEIKITCLREGVAIAPQDNFLFAGSILDNVALTDEEYDLDKVNKACDAADISKDIKDFKDGVNTLIAEGGVTVSGGQKQRISLARAIFKDSPILILDDVVSAVDVKTEENILHNIKENRVDKTTLIVASRVSTVMHMDKIIVLNKGRLEAFDTPQNLLKCSETFKTMSLLQQFSVKKGDK